jgi:5-methylcytosine-specific restriction endonuclease McrA
VKRSRLRPIGKKGAKDREELAEVRVQFIDTPCDRCRTRGHEDRMDLHHVKPRSRGGTNEPSNLKWLCRGCHGAIHDHTATDWREWIK